MTAPPSEDKPRFELHRAIAQAQRLVDKLHGDCHQIAIAGSIRRFEPHVSDIELVVVEKRGTVETPGTDLFKTEQSLVIDRLSALVNARTLQKIKGGAKYRRYIIMDEEPKMPVDVFIVHPDGFGMQLAIRTGPWRFSKKIVTQVCHGGYLKSQFRVNDGFVWTDGGKRFSVRDEKVFFEKCLSIDYVTPERRNDST